MAFSTKRAFFLFLSECHLSRKERHLYFLSCKMHQKRTEKLFLLTTWRMALTTKRAFFGSFLNIIFLEKKVICTFFLAKCIRKGQKKIPFDYMKNGSLHKKNIFFSFLNVISLEKNVTCTFCLAKCIRKGQQIVPFDYMKNGSHHKKNIFFLFLSEGHLCIKERHLYFLPCQMHQKRTKKMFLLTTWRMALFTKRAFFCSFLNIIFLEKKVICTFCLAKCITKGPKNCSFWLHEEVQKSFFFFFLFFLPLLTSSECLEKNVTCTFCLAKCIRKMTKNCSFWLHEEWLSPQKEFFFCSFLKVIFVEKNVICTFCLAKCIRKGQKNCSF